MKRNFSLTSPQKKPERHVEAIKHEIKKYLEREKRKTLPENFDAWFFDCRIGDTEASAQTIKISEINQSIDRLMKEGKPSFYLEILARPSAKPVRPKAKTTTGN